jgi:hypothetical protein
MLRAGAEGAGEGEWGQLAKAPAEVRATGGIVQRWFEAYLAGEPAEGKQTYVPAKRNGVERDFGQLKKLLEVAPGWRYQPMVIMVGGSEAKAISGPMEINGPGTGAAAVLIVHLKKAEGEWQILYWSADALRMVPGFYPQFRRRHPSALIWFDETIDDWLKPADETGVDIDIEELLGASSAPKTEETLAQLLRESRDEQATFESYFPDSIPGGQILDSWWGAKDKELYSAQEIFTIIRNGLRRTKDGKPRRQRKRYIRWVCQQYIWGKEPKNKKVVELVYYASFDAELTDISVYYGLSVAGDQQSGKVLKRLVDICMSDIYTGRILWGTKGKHESMVQYLKPYLNHVDVRVRERAAILEKVFRGEANYEEWEAEQFRRTRQEKFGEKLGAIRAVLLKGSSRQRRDVFGLAKREGLGVLFDESFVEALKACLRDRDPVVKEMAIGFGRELLCKAGAQDREMPALMSELAKNMDSKVRQQAAVFVGSCWIWDAKEPKAEAIEIMLLLSKDRDREVRNAAVYYGLSVVANKSDEVIKRLVDMAVEAGGQADLGRIIWGLQRGADKRKIMAQLQPLLSLRDKKGELARKVYFEIFKEELETEAVIF